MKGLKTGSKFQFMKDVVIEYLGGKKVLDKGLVISLINLKINVNEQRVWFRILKPHALVKDYYSNINPEVYKPTPHKIWHTSHWVSVFMTFDQFVDLVKNGDLVGFDYMYEKHYNK